MTAHTPLVLQCYCRLLRLYPADFQQRFAADMIVDVEDGFRCARRRGRGATIGFLWHAYRDVIMTIAQHALVSDRLWIWTWSLSAFAILWGATTWMVTLQWPNGPTAAGSHLRLVAVCACLGFATCLTVARLRRSVYDRISSYRWRS